MTRDQQRLADYLAHILEAIERIGQYTEDLSKVVFLDDQMAQDAVIRNIEIIGEASNNIEKHYPEFAATHPELPLHLPTRCAMRWPTAISRLTWKSCGILSMPICQGCIDRYGKLFKACPVTTTTMG
jgi:Protein of unknown function DUF86